jgi:hypothetical protein
VVSSLSIRRSLIEADPSLISVGASCRIRVVGVLRASFPVYRYAKRNSINHFVGKANKREYRDLTVVSGLVVVPD